MKLAVLLLTVGAAWGQVTPTTITDTLRVPIAGGLFRGTVRITPPNVLCGGASYKPVPVAVQVSGGALSVALVPNSQCQPAGTLYRVVYEAATGARWEESWSVPVSATPITLADVYLATGGSGGGSVVDWSNVLNRPSTFPPAAHTHHDLYAQLGGSYANPAWITALAWSKITGAPGTFPPDPHSHPNATAGAAGFMSAEDKGKLLGIAANATANSPDATLLARANHTGTQAISTVDGLQAALDGKEPSFATLGAAKGGLGVNASPLTGVIKMAGGQASTVPGVASDCVRVDGTSGPCGTGGGGGTAAPNQTYPFTSVTQLDIEHDADSKALLFEIYDSLDRQIQPNSITHLDANTTRVTFATAQTGYVVANTGSGSGGGIASVVVGDGLLGDGTSGDPVRVNPATVPSFLTGTATLNDWGTIGAQACVQKTFALAGAVSNDAVIPRWPAGLTAGLTGIVFVSAGDVIAVRVCNPTAGGIALANGNVFGATILRSF